MTSNKDLKRVVRTRMKKTGESYTTARSQVLSSKTQSPKRLAELAGMSNEAVSTKTGKSWPQWVNALDSAGANRLNHTKIAKLLREGHNLSGWWAQTVAIGYERIRGMRVVGQASDGGFRASKSRTFPVPIDRLYKAFSSKPIRDRWLKDIDLSVRTARKNRSMIFSWPDQSSVSAWFTDKAPEKSQVAVEHKGLQDIKDVARRKLFWSERFDALSELLKS